MILPLPKQYFIVAGKGEGFTPLNAFDAALGDAGVGDLNLVKVSSIVPPFCERTEPQRIPYNRYRTEAHRRSRKYRA